MKTNGNMIEAPPGWGWRPGVNLHAGNPELPDLPMLHLVRGAVTPVIRDAILSVPGLLPTLKARDLQDKYGIGRSIAFDVLRSAGERYGR